MHTLRGDQTYPVHCRAAWPPWPPPPPVRAGLDAEIEVRGHRRRRRPAVPRCRRCQWNLGHHPCQDRRDTISGPARAGTPRGPTAGGTSSACSGSDPPTSSSMTWTRSACRPNDGEPTGRLTAAELDGIPYRSLRDAWTVLFRVQRRADRRDRSGDRALPGPGGRTCQHELTESFGTVAMSRQPDKYTCAETLVHEAQHLKLCALLDLVPMTRRPDDGQRYYAPWRTDPRPASGLLQGAYAFLGVSGFWRGQLACRLGTAVRQRAQAEFARWRDGVALVVETLLGSGQLTEDGENFVATMARVLDAWWREPVPAPRSSSRGTSDHTWPSHAENGRPVATGGLRDSARQSDGRRVEVRVESTARRRPQRCRGSWAPWSFPHSASASLPAAISLRPCPRPPSCPGPGWPRSRGYADGRRRAARQPGQVSSPICRASCGAPGPRNRWRGSWPR